MRKGRAGRWRGKETGKGRKRRAVKEGVKGSGKGGNVRRGGSAVKDCLKLRWREERTGDRSEERMSREGGRKERGAGEKGAGKGCLRGKRRKER